MKNKTTENKFLLCIEIFFSIICIAMFVMFGIFFYQCSTIETVASDYMTVTGTKKELSLY